MLYAIQCPLQSRTAYCTTFKRGTKMNMMSAPTALVPAGTSALGLGFSGNLGNLDAYISAVNRLPMLTHEDEMQLGRRLKENNDLKANHFLIRKNYLFFYKKKAQILALQYYQKKLLKIVVCFSLTQIF